MLTTESASACFVVTPAQPTSAHFAVCSSNTDVFTLHCEEEDWRSRRTVNKFEFVECRTGTSLRQVRLPGAAEHYFSPRVNFQCRLSYGVRIPPCATACINIYAHVKDPVVHVRVRWIMETLTHPAGSVGWVARLCRSWLSWGKETRISHGRNPNRTI